jgi:hypothetical protein
MCKKEPVVDAANDSLDLNNNEPSILSLHDNKDDKHQVSVIDDYNGDPNTFEVLDPQKGAHVTYTIKGYDNEGPFEGMRRYTDFHKLRLSLTARMPGVYIPPIPPKQAFGNKNDKFLEERGYFMVRFLKLICRIPYIIKSDEFKCFSRPSGEIDKTLDFLPKTTPESLYERLTTEFEFVEQEDYDEQHENMSVINSYAVFIKKILPCLKSIITTIKPMITERDDENSNFQTIIDFMSKYEEGALVEYADGEADKLVVGNALNPIYIETAEDVCEKLKNPYTDYYYWVKGEIYDVQALSESIEALNRIRKQKAKLKSKIHSNEQTLEKMKSGKITLKTIFSNQVKKEGVMKTVETEIEKNDRDIELYGKIINIIENHIAQDVIPKFKEEKQTVYYRILQLVSVNEIHN